MPIGISYLLLGRNSMCFYNTILKHTVQESNLGYPTGRNRTVSRVANPDIQAYNVFQYGSLSLPVRAIVGNLQRSCQDIDCD